MTKPLKTMASFCSRANQQDAEPVLRQRGLGSVHKQEVKD